MNRKLLASALFAFAVAACVGDSTVPDAGSNVDAGCNSPKTVCTLGAQSSCTDLTSDSQNCGLCNTVCPAGTTCVSSKCACGDTTLTACGGACVNLQTDWKNCGACGHKCPNQDCTAGECDRVVFTTADEPFAALAGDGGDPLAAADALCNFEATQQQLPGTYMAWLATGAASPATRFTRSKTPYVLPNGTTRVANDWTDLTDGTLLHAIDMTSQKLAVIADITRRTITNVAPDGTSLGSSADCSDWTSNSASLAPNVGDPTATTSEWTHMAAPPSNWTCSLQFHLYCFQQ
jgi:hypothetical protein